MRGVKYSGAVSISQARHFLFILFIILLIQPLYGQTGRIQGLEIPAHSKTAQIVKHIGYELQFDDAYKQADWVAYVLDASMLVKGCKRSNDFRLDPDVRTGSSTPEDFKGTGYDRGHYRPAADAVYSCEAMSETFFMSNMGPMRPELNRRAWERLESTARTWAKGMDEPLYIVTGPVLKGRDFPRIGTNRVAVPAFFYKTILVYNDKAKAAIGFIMPNGPVQGTIESYAVTINRVEEETGLDLYPSLPDSIEEKIESSLDLSKWDFSEESKGHGHGHKQQIVPVTAPKAPAPQADGDCSYWLNTKSGVRHNRNCLNFGTTKTGRCCGPDEGKPCRRCGG